MAYKWNFSKIGGVTRVNIETGEDIAHLQELDQKMWTVLSCPVKGLEFDAKTLSLLDSDGDGKIRVNEVIEATKWIVRVIKNPELLTKQESFISLADINQSDEEGLKLYNSARTILSNLGLEKDTISIDDTKDSAAIFAKTKFNGDGIITEISTDIEELRQLINWCVQCVGSQIDRSGEAGVGKEQIESFYAACADYYKWLSESENNKSIVLPYGDTTEAAYSAVNALKDKINDYFVRCKMVAFNKETYNALELSVERLNAISDKNLSNCIDEIANYPLARINEKCELSFDSEINPAWKTSFDTLKTLVFDVEFPKKKSITEVEWLNVVNKFNAYATWQQSKPNVIVEPIGVDSIKSVIENDKKQELLSLVEQDLALKTESECILSVDKLLHYYRDIYSFLHNFVTFSDFYSRKSDKLAVFQAGTLFIDQRSCDLCIKVDDMSKHNTMAAASGMYLIYCECSSKHKNEKMTIAAVMTDGDVDNLMVGKNAIFYDRDGLDWDATVVKIIDNPISIRQAFWSPYKKFGKFINEQVTKIAASKDSKMTEDATAKITEASTSIAENPAENAQQGKQQPFDIAKFCGIFAAIGMAIGYIGGFLAQAIGGFFQLESWKMLVAIVGILLIISGPSMLLAWLSLRKRNLSPILNANGWAMNAQAYVNILFGATLTKIAKFPTLNVMDPFAKKKSIWPLIIFILIILIIIFCILYFNNWLAYFGLSYKGSCIEEFFSSFASAPIVEDVPAE